MSCICIKTECGCLKIEDVGQRDEIEEHGMEKYPIPKCANCKRYNHEENRQRNKLFCMMGCDEYEQKLNRRAFEYNRAVSGSNFDTEKQYENGNEVYGSGWKNDKGR